MAFWENMKIWQMGRLLQKREHPDVRELWTDWAADITQAIGFQAVFSVATDYQLNDLPKAPAAYLLAFVAILCEKEKHAPLLDMDEIDSAYLSDIFSGRQGWKNTVTMILPYEDVPAAVRMQRCWSRMLDYTADFLDTGIHTDTTLGRLLDCILETNEEATARNQERLLKPESIENLRRITEQYDQRWQQLCESYAAPNPTVETLCSFIQNGMKQIILTGAPGTGKTYAATEAARHLACGARIQMAQFHPSYDYTDFVEGLRPVQLEGETKSTFVRIDGSFKAFCRRVAEENRLYEPEDGESPRLYFFLIDEINRANLSQVFGELMFCLESDKRGMPVQTQYRNLPTYQIGEDRQAVPMEEDIFSEGFFIPENVVIIGTMNDIDRSVESMDFALRRRFIWHEVRVDEKLLETAFKSGNFGELLRENAEEAAGLVANLNAVVEGNVSFGLNRHYDISQGQFNLPGLHADTLTELMQFVWEYRIEPLLREYVRGEAQPETDAFIQQCRQALNLREGG